MVVLDLLNERKSSTMSEIAQSMRISMSTATAIVDNMVEESLVARERPLQDRRVVMVTLTKKGQKEADTISRKRLELIKDIFSVLTKSEKRQYLGIIKKIAEGIRKNK
jgi:DNA-binding MarR family transcriptional regulator